MNTDIQTKTRTQKDRQQYNNTNREINTKNISTIQYRPTNKGKDKNKIYEQKWRNRQTIKCNETRAQKDIST